MASTQQAFTWSFGRGRARGRGRGLQPQKPFTPSRRPGEAAAPLGQSPAPLGQSPVASSASPGKGQNTADGIQAAFQSKCSIATEGDKTSAWEDASHPSAPAERSCGEGGTPASKGSGDGARAPAMGSGPKTTGLKAGETELKAKYSYKANPDSPLGQRELCLQQGAQVVFLEKCPDNEMWWKVRREDGEEGFVPASYVEVKSDKVTQLPWLAAKQTAEEAELPKVKPEWKPYVSAYNRDGIVKEGGAAANKEQYYCKWCDKQLNGPKPYGAHMASKAHKEEIELAKEYGTYTED